MTRHKARIREVAARRGRMEASVIDSEPVYADPYSRIEWLHDRVDDLKFALANLRETVDLYVSDDIGMPELADAMDKSYAALYPPKAAT